RPLPLPAGAAARGLAPGPPPAAGALPGGRRGGSRGFGWRGMPSAIQVLGHVGHTHLPLADRLALDGPLGAAPDMCLRRGRIEGARQVARDEETLLHPYDAALAPGRPADVIGR